MAPTSQVQVGSQTVINDTIIGTLYTIKQDSGYIKKKKSTSQPTNSASEL